MALERDDNDNIVTDDKDKAETFDALFSSVFTAEDEDTSSIESHMDTGICDIVVTIDKVRQ